MNDNPTRAKMAVLNLTPEEIIEAIKLLPGPSDWRELAVGADQFRDDLVRISAAADERIGWESMGGALDTNVAAYSYKCTPAQARDIAQSIHKRAVLTLLGQARARLEKVYGERPRNPQTMELIFDDDEIP